MLFRSKAGLDYSDLFRAAARLGQTQATVVEIARRLIFNLYAANNDDHGRNHAFLYDRENARWSLAPAFDLTYAPGVLSRGLTIAGEVAPSAKTVSSFLRSAALEDATVRKLFAEVLDALVAWPRFAARAGVPGHETAEIAATHARLLAALGRP